MTGGIKAPDGTVVYPVLNSKDITSDLPWDLVDGFSNAAGDVEPNNSCQPSGWQRGKAMNKHSIFYYPYASFTNAQLPLPKTAALRKKNRDQGRFPRARRT